jgi:hypothetical protein
VTEYTEEDVERGARILCKSFRLTAFDIDDDPACDMIRRECRDAARALLSALAKEGRLLPASGQTVTQWGVRFEDGYRYKANDEVQARAVAEDPSLAVIALEQRAFTEFPDGSKLSGPWVPCEENED